MSPLASSQPWRVLRSDVALDVPWMHIRRDEVVVAPDADPVDYYVWEGSDIATVVPRTPGGDFVICRQYRHGIARWVAQFPAGQVDRGETPAQAAMRELLEETGFSGDVLTPLGVIAAYPTKFTGLHHLFMASDVERVSEPRADLLEATEVDVISSARLEQLIEDGEFMVADSVSAALLALRAIVSGTLTGGRSAPA